MSTICVLIAKHKDAHTRPTDDCLEVLSRVPKYFLVMDLASGYWQVGVDQRHREKIAFTTGFYKFKVLPFGLTNAPATSTTARQLALTGRLESMHSIFGSGI